MQKKGGDITNRPCGLGSVGFPRALLPVAIEAVSLESARRVVSVRGTELPLRPHCNLCYILVDSLGAFLGSLGSFLASFAVVVSHSDRGGFREPLVTVRCSVIHPRPLKAGYTAGSFCTTMQVFMTQSRHASTKNGSSSVMPLSAAHNSYSQR